MRDSLNKSFREFSLAEETKTEENSQQYSNKSSIFHTQFNNQRSLTIEEEETKKNVIIEPSQTEEQIHETISPQSYKNKRKQMNNITREELRRLKSSVVEEPQEAIRINLRPQRRYHEETKIKAVELCKKVGTLKVAAATSIPESTLRRWSKVGVARVGKGWQEW